MTSLSELSDQLAHAVQDVAGSVVTLRGGRRTASTATVWDDEHLLASHHAVGTQTVQVELPSGTSVTGYVVGRDRASDTAVIRVRSHGLPIPDWRCVEPPAAGHLVLIVGRPEGHIRAHWGVVSHLSGLWHTPLGAPVAHQIEVDGPLPAGFTGGPLVNADGTMAGLNSSAVIPGGTTVPTISLPGVVQRAVGRGHTGQRGTLGATVQPVPLLPGVHARAGQREGLLIRGVRSNGPSDMAGLFVGDVILRVAGAPVATLRELIRLLDHEGPDVEVRVEVLRGSTVHPATVRLGRRR